MASETITRNDLTAILNEVLPSTRIICETQRLSFTSGACVVPLKSGYALMSAIAVDRPAGEPNNYAIKTINGNADGWRLENNYASLSGQLTVKLLWVAS